MVLWPLWKRRLPSWMNDLQPKTQAFGWQTGASLSQCHGRKDLLEIDLHLCGEVLAAPRATQGISF